MNIYLADYLRTPVRRPLGALKGTDARVLYEDCAGALAARQNQAEDCILPPAPDGLRGMGALEICAQTVRQTGRAHIAGGASDADAPAWAVSEALELARAHAYDRQTLDRAAINACGRTAAAKYASLWSAHVHPILVDHGALGVQRIFADEPRTSQAIQAAEPLAEGQAVTGAHLAGFGLCAAAACLTPKREGAMAELCALLEGEDAVQTMAALARAQELALSDIELFELDCLSTPAVLKLTQALTRAGVAHTRVNLCGDGASLGGSQVSGLCALGTLALAMAGTGAKFGMLWVAGERGGMAALLKAP